MMAALALRSFSGSLSGSNFDFQAAFSLCSNHRRARHSMTEPEARILLQDWPGDSLEGWISPQPWQTIRNGWEVATPLMGWLFRSEPISPRLRLWAFPPENGAPAVWDVGPR